MGGYGDSDMDYNCLIRWDWDEEEERAYTGDNYYRNGVLKVFWMGQRKGARRGIWLSIVSPGQGCHAQKPARPGGVVRRKPLAASQRSHGLPVRASRYSYPLASYGRSCCLFIVWKDPNAHSRYRVTGQGKGYAVSAQAAIRSTNTAPASTIRHS